jgi:hypothetical protein
MWLTHRTCGWLADSVIACLVLHFSVPGSGQGRFGPRSGGANGGGASWSGAAPVLVLLAAPQRLRLGQQPQGEGTAPWPTVCVVCGMPSYAFGALSLHTSMFVYVHASMMTIMVL